MTPPVMLTILFTLLLLAFWADLKKHRIPNVISLGGIVLGLALQTWFFGADGLIYGLSGMGVGLLIFLPFYALGGMGAGDVKLMATVGVFVGPVAVLLAAAWTVLVGVPMGLAFALARGNRFGSLSRYWLMLGCFLRTLRFSYIPPSEGDVMAARFPYAIAILAGTAIALLWLVQ